MVLCIGEILADLIGEVNDGVMKYSRYPGGAPLNVAVGISRLNGSIGFIGSVGDDIIGNYLNSFCRTINFKYLDLKLDKKHNTTLAFVDNDEFGERSFAFNRYSSADYQISYDRLEAIKDADIIHIGSLMLREKKGIALANEIIRLAHLYNKKISFDVNYRDDIFNSKRAAKKAYLAIIKEADILKFSNDEVELFTGLKDYEKGLERLVRPEQLVFVTLGSKGSYYQYMTDRAVVESFKVSAVDTTGAGDAFYACTLAYLDKMKEYSKEYIIDCLRHANICGGLACSKKGAISALPTTDELEERYKCLYQAN